MKAWLITWEWDGDSEARSEKVLAILNPRWSFKKIVPMVELLYQIGTSGLVDMSENAKKPNLFFQAKVEGEIIVCGSHPRIKGRKVQNLKVYSDSQSGKETITWQGEHIYGFIEVNTKSNQKELALRKVAEGELDTYSRVLTSPIMNHRIWDREKGKLFDWWLEAQKS